MIHAFDPTSFPICGDQPGNEVTADSNSCTFHRSNVCLLEAGLDVLALVFSRVRGMDSVEVFQELLLFMCMLLDRRMARETGRLRALIPILHYGHFHTFLCHKLSCGYTHTLTPSHPHTHTTWRFW